ncbi:Cyclic nucleotide-binding protein, DUF4388 [Desulfonema limicola]|uniref:Cyclic nucleotide-binding protein, DUF4388 n=1 Tax=Desulfonema limicola TaxID=45656 RepID=A0A975GFT7_9BACT|nr:DUF4388 domain-containing protein [Desulfonema limicola]QTA79514.1 Cyclic nucleotide-binding protein, DUF4388 [Desulfonema limicola]
MRVKCHNCKAVFRVNSKLIKKQGSKTRCLKCRQIMIIYPPGFVENSSQNPKDDHARKKDEQKKMFQQPPVFRMIGGKNCPLYDLGDEFQLSGSILTVPRPKAPCMILARDVARIFKQAYIEAPESEVIGQIYQCSGCKGIIRFVKKPSPEFLEKEDNKPEDDYIEVVTRGLSDFPIFQSLDNEISREFTACLRFDEFAVGELIIKKGDPGKNLYIIISGKVEVMGDDEMRIAVMGTGEIFGEMSLLSGNTVGATIIAIEPTTVLYITGQSLKTILSSSPKLQMYFTRLLAGRMAEINIARSKEFSSGITGKISEMSPLELFQMFNMNQKTGRLTLQSQHNSASVSFRDGELVNVHYNGRQGEDAFFDLLKLKRGRFKFKPGLSLEEMESRGMGPFMPLLMEGLRRIDEDDKRFLRTIVPGLIK